MEDGTTQTGGVDIKEYQTVAPSIHQASTWETLAALPSANIAAIPTLRSTRKTAWWTQTLKMMTVQPTRSMINLLQQQQAAKQSTTE